MGNYERQSLHFAIAPLYREISSFSQANLSEPSAAGG